MASKIKNNSSFKLDNKILDKHKILNRIYKNPSSAGGFRGPSELLREIKKNKAQKYNNERCN